MAKSSFLKRLQARWKLKSLAQVGRVLLVFALTGTSVLFLKPVLFSLTGLSEQTGWQYTVLYLLLVLPLYQVLLLAYGFLLGEFRFFWEFEKRMVRRMLGRRKEQTPPPKAQKKHSVDP